MSNEIEQLKQLVEETGLVIENRLSISPLAARIYALLILSSLDGLTFDEIRAVIEASKSSTSVNVNVLIQLGYIEYYTKPGDRKRYFKIAKYFQLVSLEKYQKAIESDIQIVEKINAYNKDSHPEKWVELKPLVNSTQDYLKKLQDLVRETVEKIDKINNDNH